MSFRPSGSLRTPTFVALLVAQFLAAFNDQAIHASAMYFALHQSLLNEKQAISLMPILFYAPWAVFCTLAGYLADRYSKRSSLVFWKFAEIVICAVALVGFHLGSAYQMPIGPILVLGCVFLMGTHSAFFVPAKYGAMPEILEPQLLSRGNGILESLSFLAVILGTVCGGTLSYFLHGNETWIGAIFLIIAVVGAVASLWIEKMPAASPDRPFPPYIFGPLKSSLHTLLSARPLALAVVGIAFFTFVVAFMRQTVYMLGEAQVERWTELKTSLIVGSTALGIGLGSPLAGFLSGRKVELGLVPLGGVGMVLAALAAAAYIHSVPALVVCIIVIGFFTGFYLVPLYTLLQHRSPKSSKGDAVAISNFINVTGAILASFMFFGLVSAFQQLGYARLMPFTPFTTGTLTKLVMAEGRVTDFEIDGRAILPAKGKFVVHDSAALPPELPDAVEDHPSVVVDYAKADGVEYFYLRPADEEPPTVYDNSGLPRFLFVGAAAITTLILFALWAIMPDLHKRAAWVARHLFRTRVRAVGTHFVPVKGPVFLATNCTTADECALVRSASDRLITFIDSPVNGGGEAVNKRIRAVLLKGDVVALLAPAMRAIEFTDPGVEVLPVYVGPNPLRRKEIEVSFGPPLPAGTDTASVEKAIAAAAQVQDDFQEH